MITPEFPKLLFVINPKSGAKKNVDYEAEIKKHFETLPHTLEFFSITKNDSDEALKKAIGNFKPQRVIAVGGDGTVTMVAKQLLGSSLPMGILPAGSANGMAKELDIPVDIKTALEIVLSQNIKCADVILINEKEICLHLSDVGMNAQLIKYFKSGGIRGMIGYARMITKVLFHIERMKISVQSKNEELLRSAVMVAFANARKYGTGATINPEGDIYDGMFEVLIVRKLGLVEIVKMFLKFQRFNPKKIEVLHATSVIIETSRHVHFQIDGEYRGRVDRVSAKVLPAKLNLILPEDKENARG